jgi:hypothetical protein
MPWYEIIKAMLVTEGIAMLINQWSPDNFEGI